MNLQRFCEIVRTGLILTLSGFELRTQIFVQPNSTLTQRREYVRAKREFKEVKNSQKNALKRSGTREGKIIINKKQKV